MTEQIVPEEKLVRTHCKLWKRVGIFFSTVATIIFLAAFAYGYFQLANLNRQLAQITSALQKREASGQQDISGLQNTVNTLQQSMQKSQELSSQQAQLLSDWRAASAGDLNKWHVAQAEYLVKMANDQLQFAHNIKMAIQLLQQADKELQSSQDPALLEVRKSLATDLANLQALPQVDITSVFLRLHAINELIDKLPLPIQPLKSESQQTLSAAPSSGWKAGLDSVLQGLNKIVIIRKNDASALPLVMPEEKIFIYQNLHAQLESASWGLLHDNATVYTTSLARAMGWIQQYFVQDAQETKTVMQQLAELPKIDIQPAVITLTTLQLFAQMKTVQ